MTGISEKLTCNTWIFLFIEKGVIYLFKKKLNFYSLNSDNNREHEIKDTHRIDGENSCGRKQKAIDFKSISKISTTSK